MTHTHTHAFIHLVVRQSIKDRDTHSDAIFMILFGKKKKNLLTDKSTVFFFEKEKPLAE